MRIDDAGSIEPNSVLVDNTTLFTCLPIAEDAAGHRHGGWAGKEWADDLVDRGMSNLVESLILHEVVYVDGEVRYQAPVVEGISEQFPGLIRGMGIDSDREDVFRHLSGALDESGDLGRNLYSIAFHASMSARTRERLHLSHIYGFLLEEITDRQINGYLPDERRIDPLVFRTFFYLALSALSGLPYTPYPLRNPIVLALSEQELPRLISGNGAPSYHDIAHGILQSFDDNVRGHISERLQGGQVRLPALPVPSFWEMIKQKSGGNRAAMVEEILQMRDQAKPYRDYVGAMTAAYASGDITFLHRQQEILDALAHQLSSTTRLPRVHWKRLVIPVKIKLPFLELDQLAARLPTRSPFHKPQFAFLHDWASRRF